MPLSIALSPEGHLLPDGLAEESDAFADRHEAAALAALEGGDASALLWLASRKTAQELPMAAVFWRELAGKYLTAFCQHGGKVPEPRREEWWERIEQAPPMRGAEHLTPEVLSTLWQILDRHVTELVLHHPGGTEAWLQDMLPHWHLVGRVIFHLAENKKDPQKPFAFLATYTNGLNAEGKPRHLPLQQAIKYYSGAQHRTALIKLLEPVSRAAEKSAWARQLVDSGVVYRPQAWSPAQALKFLHEIPALEEAGISVRIPDWWKPAAPPRPRVKVSVGDISPSAFGVDGLLSFNIELTLDGEKLTPEEIKALKSAEGLVLLKGKWVEADAEKLQEVLDHWQHAQQMHFGEGVSFLEAMRLLSGAPLEGREQEVLTQNLHEWSGIEAGPWLENLLQDLRDPSRLEEFHAHPDLKATLRPYQSEGVNWLHFMSRLGLGACLADDMGLGKTIQVLALLLQHKRRAPQGAPSLLVAPASLLANWKAEAEQFAPSLKLFIAHPSGGEAERLTTFTEGRPGVLDDTDLVITSYGMVLRLEALRRQPWRLAVLDEAQAIKNPGAAQTRAVKELRAITRLVLTGTPVENRIGDLWSLFDFINPGLLGTAAAFGRFVKSLAREKGLNYAPLRKLVRPYILRRSKTDKSIISDLPDKTELNAWCLLTKTQATLYQKTVNQLAESLKKAESKERQGVVLAALVAFKQICNHPAQRSGDAHYDPALSGKFQRLRELCQPIAERQERVLIFTQFTEIIPALHDYLKGIFGRDGLILTGQTPVKLRRQLVETFQRDNSPPFFLLSLKAGGTGLTLTAASHVIHFDRWWNPAVENQATDRAYRIGQQKNVLVHKFVCKGTLEEKIDQVITEKRGLAEGVLSDGAELPFTEMSDAELLSFVSLDVSQISGDE